MGTISAKTLKNALTKARNVGLVEEAFSIEGFDLVLRNLRPDEYSALIRDCEGLENMEYLYQYQKGHLCRSIIEIDGVDLRDMEFVQIEEDDGKKVKLELHKYLTDHMINTWSKEVLYTVFRKFSDVVEQAERKAKQGITFLLPEETDEERYRRLITEAKSVEDELPGTLVDSILEELGLMRRSTADEVRRAMERTDQLAREQKETSEASAIVTTETPVVEEEVPLVVKPQTRLVDPHATFQRAVEARRAASPSIQPPAPVVAPTVTVPPISGRSARLAAIEAGTLDPALLAAERLQSDSDEIVELKKQPPMDHKSMTGILGQPAQGGLNPRFKPRV